MKNSPAFEQAAVERVCADFVERGETVADWARARGFEPPQVYAVLAGRNKGRFGRGHEIAVALGLKAESAIRQQASVKTDGEHGQVSGKSGPQSVGNEFTQAVMPGGNASVSDRRRA